MMAKKKSEELAEYEIISGGVKTTVKVVMKDYSKE